MATTQATTQATTHEILDGRPIVIETPLGDVMPADALRPDERAREQREYAAIGILTRATSPGPGRVRGRLLAPDELAVWHWRYPMTYDRPTGRIHDLSMEWMRRHQVRRRDERTTEPIGAMQWPVPAEVRQIMLKAIDEGRMDLEIWTPELKRGPWRGFDPILVGWDGHHYWLLARWAEALEPFEEIAARMKTWRGRLAMWIRRAYIRRSDMEVLINGIIWGTFGSILVGVFVGMAANSHTVGIAGAGISSALAVVTTAVTMLVMRGPGLRWARRYAGWIEAA